MEVPDGVNTALLYVWLTILVLASACAVIFMYFGSYIVNKLPPIRQLNSMRDQWGKLYINRLCEPGRLPEDRMIGQLCHLRFEEVSNPDKRDRNRRFGDIMSVVHYSPQYVSKIVVEISNYARVFLLLLVVGILYDAPELLTAKPTMSDAPSLTFCNVVPAVGQAMLAKHVVPIGHLILIGLSALRLWMEIKKINFLLEVKLY